MVEAGNNLQLFRLERNPLIFSPETTQNEPEMTTQNEPEMTTQNEPEMTTQNEPEMTTQNEPEMTTELHLFHLQNSVQQVL